jgi:hypothetical protein
MNDPKANDFDAIWGMAGAASSAAENTADEKPEFDLAFWEAVFDPGPLYRRSEWWKEPAECPVRWMMEMFPVKRLN